MSNLYNAPGATDVEIHLTNNTEASLLTALKTCMIGGSTNTGRLVWKDDDDTQWRAPCLDSSDVIALPYRISHEGDPDTLIEFHGDADRIRALIGNVVFLDLIEAAQDVFSINPDSVDIDISIKTAVGDSLLIAGDTGNVTIQKSLGVGGVTTPAAPIDILLTDASTNTALELLRLKRRTTGTPADGIGSYISFWTQNSVPNVFPEEETGRLINRTILVDQGYTEACFEFKSTLLGTLHTTFIAKPSDGPTIAPNNYVATYARYGAATTVAIAGEGSNTNIDFKIVPKGTGSVVAAGPLYAESTKRVACGGGTTNSSSSTVSGSVTLEIDGVLRTLALAG